MGWCAEFGCRIRDGCDHAMVAGRKACTCPECAVVCKGRFTGCPEVWVAGPRPGNQPVLKRVPAFGPANAPAGPRHAAPAAAPIAAPAAPAARPAPDLVGAALASIRHDVESVHLDLSDTIAGLKELRDVVDELARTAGASIQSLRQELAVVTARLAQQQATLDRLTESPTMALSVRSAYEQLIEDRRLRAIANPGSVVSTSLAGPFPTSDDSGRRGVLPRLPRPLHVAHPGTHTPTPAPDPQRPAGPQP